MADLLLSLVLGLLPFSPLWVPLWPGVWRRRGSPVADPTTELDRRRLVWDVLSDLYLDTELDERDRAYIAEVLSTSGYSIAELDEVLYRELHPVLFSNLLSVAGEWAGFDQDWLEARILGHRWPRPGLALIPGMWVVRREWRTIQAMLQAPSLG